MNSFKEKNVDCCKENYKIIAQFEGQNSIRYQPFDVLLKRIRNVTDKNALLTSASRS